MRFENNGEKLIIYLEGELNSNNADSISQEIDDIIKNNIFSKIVLDVKDLNYISSAGLRVILKIKKQYNDFSIINASLEVYNIFQITGFSEMMDITKALRNVDISGAKIIGEGFFSTVYRINKDTIVKVFNRTSDENQIQRELLRAKQAFVLGIPTAISFDIVSVGDKLGVRFEMLDCKTLRDVFRDDPNRYDDIIVKYGELIKKINNTVCTSEEIPSINKAYEEKLEVIKPYLDNKQYSKLEKMIKGIKEANTFVHGDCHMKNIMVQGDELLLIDMDTLSVGNPIFELAHLYASHLAFEEGKPGNNIEFFGLDASYVSKIYEDIIRLYFGKYDVDVVNKIRIVSYVFMMWWNLINSPDDLIWLESSKAQLIKLINQYDDLNI